MSNLVRMSLSLEKPLLDHLEAMVARSQYTNRSEFVRDMIRRQIVEQEWQANEDAVGTITLVYDHHARTLSKKLTELQHRHHRAILASTHVHLTHDTCVEMILARGSADHIREIADLLGRQKGVLHASLSTSSTGKRLV